MEISYPKGDSVCRGCVEGKMPSPSFPQLERRASKPFEKVHMDLKSMLVPSYYKNCYFIVFYDDFTSHGWTAMLKLKLDASNAIWQFNAMVKTQFTSSIKEFQIDDGGEFKGWILHNYLWIWGSRSSVVFHICTNKTVVLNASSRR